MKEEFKRNNENRQYESKEPNEKISERKEDEKKVDEMPIDSNSDSNKSNGPFLNPSSHITSSSVSTSKELTYMTPKSMHNLNLLFTQSNGKKTHHQRRIMNTSHDFSPVENKFLNYTFNIPMSPIDPSKIGMQLSQPTNKAINLNNYNMSSIHESNIKNIKDINHMNQMNMNMRNNNLQVPTPNYIQNTNSNIPQYIFNNNEGMMSINIEHRHIYDTRTINENNKRVNRKIEFTDNEVNNAPISSSMNQSQNIKLRNLNNFGGIISRKRVIETDEKITSENVSVEDIESDSENLVKPQAIPGRSLSKLNNTAINQSGRIFMNPYTNYPIESSLADNTVNKNTLENLRSILYSPYKMNPNEYQHKLEMELNKKTQSCNCKKSKCLKLYCECFANGEYCINCNCTDCSNVIGNELEKEEAFKLIKDKNPVAIKLNVVKEEETDKVNNETKIGCNCTKSNCSKKYCECYKANVKCSEICRCRDCGNASERLKIARNSFNAHIHRDKELELNQYNSYKTNTASNMNEHEFYNYDEFSIEKISVLIENKKLFVDKKTMKDFEKKIFLTEKNYSLSQMNYNNHIDNLEKEINDNLPLNPSVELIRKNGSIFLEISRSILNSDGHNMNYLVQTPTLNKFRKRNRNNSLDSSNSFYNINNISGHHKLTKTACETNKKINIITKIPKGIGKKLILDDADK